MYPAWFYRANPPVARKAAEAIVPELIRLAAPRSVVDVGCGTGTWLAVFREHGVEDVIGIDRQAGESLPLEIPAERYVQADLSAPLHLGRRFDLALCLEVAQDVAPGSADVPVQSLAELAPCILFSSAIPFQRGIHNLNDQWPEYWAARFRSRGYIALDCIRPRVWSDPDVAWWYAQNAILYSRPDPGNAPAAMKEALQLPTAPVRALVHPGNYLEQLDPSRVTPSRIWREIRAWLRMG